MVIFQIYDVIEADNWPFPFVLHHFWVISSRINIWLTFILISSQGNCLVDTIQFISDWGRNRPRLLEYVTKNRLALEWFIWLKCANLKFELIIVVAKYFLSLSSILDIMLFQDIDNPEFWFRRSPYRNYKIVYHFRAERIRSGEPLKGNTELP